MIKFFRKIRQKMIKENQVAKYLLYAIGEILLVIIGILIALTINNRNLAKQNETKFEALFKEVNRDLETEIIETNRVLKNNTKKDSLLNLVINNLVSHKEYEQSNDLRGLAIVFSTMDFSNNSYNILSNEIDKIPEKYKEVVNSLNKLYLKYKENIIYHDTQITDIIEEIDKKWSESETWYSGYPVIQAKKEKIEHMLNNPFYKNDAKRIKYELDEIIPAIEKYKYEAARCYLDIAKIIAPKMDLPEIITSYIVDVSADTYEQYVGSYFREGNPEVVFSLSEGDFYWSLEGQNDRTIWIPKSDTTFVSIDYPFSIVINKNSDNVVLGFTLKIVGVDELRPYVKME